MLKGIHKEILALKTNRLRTSSAIAVDSYSQNASLEWQMHDPGWGKFAFINYNIYIDLDNSNPSFAQLIFSNIENLFNNQDDIEMVFKPPMDDGVACYNIIVYAGSDEQSIISRLENGETVTFDTTLIATATEEITGIRLEKLPWPQ